MYPGRFASLTSAARKPPEQVASRLQTGLRDPACKPYRAGERVGGAVRGRIGRSRRLWLWPARRLRLRRRSCAPGRRALRSLRRTRTARAALALGSARALVAALARPRTRQVAEHARLVALVSGHAGKIAPCAAPHRRRRPKAWPGAQTSDNVDTSARAPWPTRRGRVKAAFRRKSRAGSACSGVLEMGLSGYSAHADER